MPGTRTTAKKPGPRKAKKVTAADLRANMRELQELHKETEKTLDEFIAETRKSAAGEDVKVTPPLTEARRW